MNIGKIINSSLFFAKRNSKELPYCIGYNLQVNIRPLDSAYLTLMNYRKTKRSGRIHLVLYKPHRY